MRDEGRRIESAGRDLSVLIGGIRGQKRTTNCTPTTRIVFRVPSAFHPWPPPAIDAQIHPEAGGPTPAVLLSYCRPAPILLQSHSRSTTLLLASYFQKPAENTKHREKQAVPAMIKARRKYFGRKRGTICTRV